MTTIEKVCSFSEFETFVCHTTQWYVWHDHKLTLMHTKDRYIMLDSPKRWTDYSTWDCATKRFTSHVER